MNEERFENLARLNELWFKAATGVITGEEADEGRKLEYLFETGPRLEMLLERTQGFESLQEVVQDAIMAFQEGVRGVEELLRNASVEITAEGKQFYINEVAIALGFNISK